jgi:hypothetical protein
VIKVLKQRVYPQEVVEIVAVEHTRLEDVYEDSFEAGLLCEGVIRGDLPETAGA